MRIENVEIQLGHKIFDDGAIKPVTPFRLDSEDMDCTAEDLFLRVVRSIPLKILSASAAPVTLLASFRCFPARTSTQVATYAVRMVADGPIIVHALREVRAFHLFEVRPSDGIVYAEWGNTRLELYASEQLPDEDLPEPQPPSLSQMTVLAEDRSLD